MIKLYPQCISGVIPPFITCQGYVLPCCMQSYLPKIKTVDGKLIDNPFIREEHNIYNKNYLEIISSDSWKEMIANVASYNSWHCNSFCGKKIPAPFAPNTNSEYKKNFKSVDWDVLQFELTNTCTLNCSYCIRQVRPYRNNRDHIDLDVIWKTISARQWNRLIDCSIYGDPIWYRYNFELLDRMIENTCFKQYSISLSATGRGIDYWQQIIAKWKALNEKGVEINLYFGIDGSEEVSKIYRKNQNWEEITTALQLVSNTTNIKPILQFIPFRWNEHEIDYMMLLAEKWKAKFYLKKSSRFSKNDPNKPKDPTLYLDLYD